MAVPIVGTSACIWCGAPVSLYKGAPYTKYCARPAICWTGNWKTLYKYKRISAKAALLNKCKRYVRVVVEFKGTDGGPNLYTAMQTYHYIRTKAGLKLGSCTMKTILDGVYYANTVTGSTETV